MTIQLRYHGKIVKTCPHIPIGIVLRGPWKCLDCTGTGHGWVLLFTPDVQTGDIIAVEEKSFVGFRGVMREAKGRRYWEMVPEIKRQGYVFAYAAVWRDNQIVYLFGYSSGGRELQLRVNRKTGEVT